MAKHNRLVLHEVDPDNLNKSLPIADDGSIAVLGIHGTKLVKVVSILYDPLLYVEDKLFDVETKSCMAHSMLCRNPTKKSNNTQWIVTCCYGHSIDLLRNLMKVLNFKSDIYLVEDHKFGSFHNATSFNGLVGDVYSKKADIAVAALSITHERSRYIDFTSAFLEVDIGIATKRNTETFKLFEFTFAKTFSTIAAWIVAVVFASAIIAIYTLENIELKGRNFYNKKFRGRITKLKYSFAESFSYTSGLLFQRDIGGKNPTAFSSRATGLLFAFGMVGFTAMYTASLTADQVMSHFQGLEDSRVGML